MSYIFECEDRSLWSPSNVVAGVFLRQLQNLVDLLGIETGFEETMGSIVEVKPNQLGHFLAATATYLKSCDNPSLRALLRPAVIHLMVIYSRCESASPIVGSTSFEDDWVAESKQLADNGLPR